jgi:hypothetical protein
MLDNSWNGKFLPTTVVPVRNVYKDVQERFKVVKMVVRSIIDPSIRVTP